MRTVQDFANAYPAEYARFKFHLLPDHMQHGFAEYVLYGQPMGHFGTACLEDRLVAAFSAADQINTARMADTASWLYNHCPIDARGSQAKVRAWIEQGGLVGWMAQQAAG